MASGASSISISTLINSLKRRNPANPFGYSSIIEFILLIGPTNTLDSKMYPTNSPAVKSPMTVKYAPTIKLKRLILRINK